MVGYRMHPHCSCNLLLHLLVGQCCAAGEKLTPHHSHQGFNTVKLQEIQQCGWASAQLQALILTEQGLWIIYETTLFFFFLLAVQLQKIHNMLETSGSLSVTTDTTAWNTLTGSWTWLIANADLLHSGVRRQLTKGPHNLVRSMAAQRAEQASWKPIVEVQILPSACIPMLSRHFRSGASKYASFSAAFVHLLCPTAT